jgi:inhibitor of KinA
VTSVEPVGDYGVLARFAEERQALAWSARVRDLGHPAILDVVGAYRSVAVYHDPQQLSIAQLLALVATISDDPVGLSEGRVHQIPCCYSLGLDLERITAHTGLSIAEIVALHTGWDFTIFAIGFCPGFPYLGYLPDALANVPRLESPRVRVEAGSVGLTGRQTGIYTETRPGGWNILGRTPLLLVDTAAGWFPLRTGDQVRFTPIDEAEYGRLLGQRYEPT